MSTITQTRRTHIGGLALAAVIIPLTIATAASCRGPSAPGVSPEASTSPAAATAPTSSLPAASIDAAAFCASNGGSVETRQLYMNTNLDQTDWVQLPGSIELCRFESDDADASRLYIDINSLAATTTPSLAADAYLAKVPLPSITDVGNPATAACTRNVGGAAAFGTSANGGGLVNLDDPVFTVVDLCVFANGSAIDQWAIAYYAGGITRGADLATIFRFDPTDAAGVFPANDG